MSTVINWQSVYASPPKEEKLYLCGGSRGGIFIGTIRCTPNMWQMQGTNKVRKAEYYAALPEVPR